MIGDVKPKSGKDLLTKAYQVCGTFDKNIKNGRRITVKCKSKPTGKFVFVVLPRTGVLKLCKVKIYEKTKPPTDETEKPEEPEEPEGISSCFEYWPLFILRYP